MYEAALAVAERLEDTDYRIDERERYVELTVEGKKRLGQWAEELPRDVPRRASREELITQALQASRLFERDTHYPRTRR
jgi:preprotein translocase subunit SecA